MPERSSASRGPKRLPALKKQLNQVGVMNAIEHKGKSTGSLIKIPMVISSFLLFATASLAEGDRLKVNPYGVLLSDFAAGKERPVNIGVESTVD